VFEAIKCRRTRVVSKRARRTLAKSSRRGRDAGVRLCAVHEIGPQTLLGLTIKESSVDKNCAVHEIGPQTLLGLTIKESSVDTNSLGECDETIVLPKRGGSSDKDFHSIMPPVDEWRCRLNEIRHESSGAFQTLSGCRPSQAYGKFPFPRKVPILLFWFLFLFIGFFAILHEALQAQAKATFEDWYQEQGVHDGRSGWLFVARAGLANRRHGRKESLPPASRPAGRGAFFLVLDVACPSIGTAARTWVIPLQALSWRECLVRRFPDLDLHSLSGTFTFNGKQLSACVPSLELHNRVVRLRSYALPGGMPAPDFAAMRKDALMAEAKAIGVDTRREITKADGSKHRTWRSTAEVARDCAAAWESRHQRPDICLEGPVSSSAASNQSASSAPPVAPVDLDTQPQLLADLATLSTHELRKACQARGITTKCQRVHLSKEQLLQRLAAVTAMQPKTSSGSASTHASVSGVAKTSGSQVLSLTGTDAAKTSSASVSLRSYFTLRCGPAPIPALAASAPAQSPDGKLAAAVPKLRRRIALRPAWCYSKEKRDRHRKRMATEAAKAETRKRMATEAAKAKCRARMATEAAKAKSRARMTTEAAKAKSRARMATEAAKAKSRARMATEAAKAKSRARMATEAAKAETRKRMTTEAAKAETRKRMATEAAKAETRKRMATEAAKAETRKRMATEAAKAETRRRKATLTAKAKDRARKATPKARMKQAQWRAARRLQQRTQETHRDPQDLQELD